jgi:hypothetical protein
MAIALVFPAHAATRSPRRVCVALSGTGGTGGAASGGALCVAGGSVTLINDTFSGNTATGLAMSQGAGTLDVMASASGYLPTEMDTPGLVSPVLGGVTRGTVSFQARLASDASGAA